MHLRFMATGVLGAVFAVSAFADTMKFIETGYGRSAKISINGGDSYRNVFGGVLNMKYTGSTGSIILDAFCADPTVSMADGHFGVTRTDSSFRGTKGLHAGYLVNKYAPGIFTGGGSGANRDQAFALQVALWEVLTESTGSYNVASGSFRVKNSDGTALTSSQKELINTYINDFGQQAATYYKAAVNNIGKPCSQSVITPVPEPASMTALALGFGAILRRRRKK